MESASHTGRLLVASPLLVDPNFYRTVVFMIEHDAEGALGVVLNRPLPDAPVGEFLEAWESLVAEPPVIFLGGPVQREVALAIARSPAETAEWPALAVHDVGLVDLDSDPASVEVEEIRVFSGYAAWAPGQLEAEIEEGAWWVVDGTADDAFTLEAEDLWRRVLRRQPGRLRIFASTPERGERRSVE